MRSLARKAWTTLAVALIPLTPVLVWASEGGEKAGNPWVSLGLKFVNFAILVGGLFYILRKTVSQGLADRQEAVRKALEEAKAAKEAAEAKYREYKEKVAGLEEQVRAIHQDFKAEGQRQKERILREADAAAEGIRRQAEAAGANEVKRATDELRLEMAEIAVRFTEEILSKAYNAEDQKKAVRQTIQNIERVH